MAGIILTEFGLVMVYRTILWLINLALKDSGFVGEGLDGVMLSN